MSALAQRVPFPASTDWPFSLTIFSLGTVHSHLPHALPAQVDRYRVLERTVSNGSTAVGCVPCPDMTAATHPSANSSLPSFLDLQSRPNEVESEKVHLRFPRDGPGRPRLVAVCWPSSSRALRSTSPALACARLRLRTCRRELVRPGHLPCTTRLFREKRLHLARACPLRHLYCPLDVPQCDSAPNDESHAITTAKRGRLLGKNDYGPR